MDIHREFGRLLRIARERRGWSQYQLAAAAGLSQQAISGYERGLMSPTMFGQQVLAEVLGVEFVVSGGYVAVTWDTDKS